MIFLLTMLTLSEVPSWAPVPRPTVAISIERALPDQYLAPTSVVVEAAVRAFEVSYRLRAKVLDAGSMAACGGSFECRVEVARVAEAALLALVFVDDSETEARFRVGLWDTRGERLPSRGGEVVVSSTAAIEVGIKALVRAQSEICEARGWGLANERTLVGLPGRTVVTVGALDMRTDSEGLRLVELPLESVELRVDAEDYLPWRASLSPGPEPLEVELAASPARWVRRGLLGVSVAALVGGAATIVIATTTADRAACVRASAGSCVPVWPGSNALDAGLSVPLGFGLVTMGAVGTASAVWDGQPETSWLAAAVGVFLGAAATAVAYGAGS